MLRCPLLADEGQMRVLRKVSACAALRPAPLSSAQVLGGCRRLLLSSCCGITAALLLLAGTFWLSEMASPAVVPNPSAHRCGGRVRRCACADLLPMPAAGEHALPFPAEHGGPCGASAASAARGAVPVQTCWRCLNVFHASHATWCVASRAVTSQRLMPMLNCVAPCRVSPAMAAGG